MGGMWFWGSGCQDDSRMRQAKPWKKVGAWASCLFGASSSPQSILPDFIIAAELAVLDMLYSQLCFDYCSGSPSHRSSP
jgi:hypothetical protein